MEWALSNMELMEKDVIKNVKIQLTIRKFRSSCKQISINWASDPKKAFNILWTSGAAFYRKILLKKKMIF